MKPTILILSNSNLFTVYAHLSLRGETTPLIRHLRYANEDMDRTDHFIQQLEDYHHNLYVERGLSSVTYEFAFTDRLCYRLEQTLSRYDVQMIFYEMKLGSQSEWMLLHHLSTEYNVPVVAIIPPELDSDIHTQKLLRCGAKEAIVDLSSEALVASFRRHT